MMDVELSPCPFCDGKAEVDRTMEKFEYSTGGPNSVMDYGYIVYCTGCGAGTNVADVPPNTSDEAIAQWNRRTIDKGIFEALTFAKSVILSGEPWTETCERVIQGALNKAKGVSIE